MELTAKTLHESPTKEVGLWKWVGWESMDAQARTRSWIAVSKIKTHISDKGFLCKSVLSKLRELPPARAAHLGHASIWALSGYQSIIDVHQTSSKAMKEGP